MQEMQLIVVIPLFVIAVVLGPIVLCMLHDACFFDKLGDVLKEWLKPSVALPVLFMLFGAFLIYSIFWKSSHKVMPHTAADAKIVAALVSSMTPQQRYDVLQSLEAE